MPRDISAAFRNLANAYEMMRTTDGDVQPIDSNDALLGQLISSLMESAEHPPSEVQGVSDEYIEQLERVPKKKLKEDMSCPICGNPFLEGMYTPCYPFSFPIKASFRIKVSLPIKVFLPTKVSFLIGFLLPIKVPFLITILLFQAGQAGSRGALPL